MDLSLNNDQQMLSDSAQRFASEYYSFEHRRSILTNTEGHDRNAWRQFAELGWLAINVPEEHGGLGGTYADLLVLAQALAPAIIVEPWSSTVFAVELLKRVGTPEQQRRYLPAIVDGSERWTVAFTEPGARYNIARISTTARDSDAGSRVSGTKFPVLHLPMADHIIVTAKSPDEQVALFVVDPLGPGVTIRPFETIDGQRAAELRLNDVSVKSTDVLGNGRDAREDVSHAMDIAAAILCAEAAGTMHCLNTITAEYLRSRKQFGEPIGRFQALQHRMADMYIAEQRSMSAVTMLRLALDGASALDRQRAVSLAKIQIDKSGRYIGQQSVQLHGGIGISDEYIVGHYFKRLIAIGAQYGELNFHLDRVARLGA